MTTTLPSTLLVSTRKGRFETAPPGGPDAVISGHFLGDNDLVPPAHAVTFAEAP